MLALLFKLAVLSVAFVAIFTAGYFCGSANERELKNENENEKQKESK